ncbi:hypothetical protein [Herbaspirillum huttiense]|uniref:hypothetical protein n=1 Tax=Herbaspirillum huttiense TaxID=863372 RepID=UPI0031CF4F55
MKKTMLAALLVLTVPARAEYVPSSALNFDPAKQKVCAARSSLKGPSVPFEMNDEYFQRARSVHPDVTYIAIDGASPQLVECFLRDGTGKFEPNSYSPEGNGSYWRTIKPEQFKPGIKTSVGIQMAVDKCIQAAQEKINLADYSHSVYSTVQEVTLGKSTVSIGTSIAGIKASRYDIAVAGTSFFNSTGLDRRAVNFTCLLSPMLQVKSVQIKR